ncbi:hypothetical protein RSAG8_01102, partial [Rhizoctonia solani AG-8 WAC10335]
MRFSSILVDAMRSFQITSSSPGSTKALVDPVCSRFSTDTGIVAGISKTLVHTSIPMCQTTARNSSA